LKTLFNNADYLELKNRLETLQPANQRQWGKMDVAQMLSHAGKAIEMSLGIITPPPDGNAFFRFIVRTLIKPMTLGNKPFSKNSPTSKAIKIADAKIFAEEKSRLLSLLLQAHDYGENGKWHPHSFFGNLTGEEWGRLTYKHVDHHLRQFSA